MTPFADGWSHAWRQVLRMVFVVALIGEAVLLGSVSFTSLTLLIGGPFYEHIAEGVKERLGLDIGGDGAGRMCEFARGARDGVRFVLATLVGAVMLFLLDSCRCSARARSRYWRCCSVRGW